MGASTYFLYNFRWSDISIQPALPLVLTLSTCASLILRLWLCNNLHQCQHSPVIPALPTLYHVQQAPGPFRKCDGAKIWVVMKTRSYMSITTLYLLLISGLEVSAHIRQGICKDAEYVVGWIINTSFLIQDRQASNHQRAPSMRTPDYPYKC